MTPRRFRRAHPAAGARPGTLVIPAGSPPPRIFVVHYGPDEVTEREIASPADLPDTFPEGTVTWVDVHGYGDEAVIRAIGEHFGMSALAIEDAVNVPQRPKSEVYAKHHLVIACVPLEEGRTLALPQVCFVIGTGVLLTFQERPFGLFGPVRERIREGVGPIRTAGADYLAYALIDSMVDRYYPAVEAVTHDLDDIEDALLDDSETEAMARLRSARQRLVLMRRIGAPQAEMVTSLLREPSPWIDAATREYLRDTHDHITQIVELVDGSRETAAALSDELLSMVGQKTNEIMKVLTLMASIFIPLTFITGIYGMNFEHMPALQEPQGYYFVLALMAVVAAAMLWYFYRRGWLHRPRRSRRRSPDQ